jgi:hypothetical protein
MADPRRLGVTGPSTGHAAIDQALNRVVGEIVEGLRHGHFEYVLTCEIVGQERRRLTLRAGKSYQFVIPKEDCVRSALPTADSRDGSDTNAT